MVELVYQKVQVSLIILNTKDGKITMKDVLMGRGVIPKKKGKKKMMAKKKKTETPMQKAVKKNKNKKRII